MNLTQLGRVAVRAAARLRADCGVGAADALCPFDLAERVGVVVRLVGIPSLEGMYTPGPKPTMLVSAERPPGRRRYTCGHELGHHIFGHHMRLDELAEDSMVTWSPEEFLAHRFAAALLMPKLAVESAFARRGWSVTTPSASEIFTVAQHLGVGYRTLIGHLERTLNCLTSDAAMILRRASLPELRSQTAGFNVSHDLMVVDEHWGGRPVDMDVGDVALLPPAAKVAGECASFRAEPMLHLLAVAPGAGTLRVRERPIQIRVSRRCFTGLARFRHLEEVADDQ